MKAVPLFDRIILKQLPKEDTVKSGLIIPEQAIEVDKGTIESVGEECKAVRSGDIVLFPKGSGVTITMENENYLLMDERNLLAII